MELEFEEKRRELLKAKMSASERVSPLRELNEREAHGFVFRWFQTLEKKSEEWWQSDGIQIPPEHLADTLDTLRIDEMAFSGGNESYVPDDGNAALDAFLQQEGLQCPKDSSAYRTLRPLFRMALLENCRRTIDRVTHKTIRPREPLFREIFAHSEISTERGGTTLGELLRRFDKMLVDTKRADVTRRTYKIPARVLREVLGERTPLFAITKQKVEELFELLQRVPTNATKRFPKLTLKDAIAVADKRGEQSRLSQKSLENYLVNIAAIFNFAVEEELMASNPAKGRILRAIVQGGEKRSRKAKFTDNELNRLFRAPLYTGCKDDESGYAKPGTNKPRRARFWLPLVGLFHGLRSNEAAQLFTEDIAEIEGIRVFKIRTTRESGEESDKRLKSRQSERNVPIHPELLRIGFLEYVAERRRDTSNPRLFPHNPRGADGYYSTPFGKWFARFKKMTLGENCKATFHSFRHHFRDAMRDAEISTDYAEALGGWSNDRRSSERLYGTGPSLQKLREKMEMVKYPRLDLSHLHSAQPIAPSCRVRLNAK